MVRRLVEACPPGGRVLDVARGTGTCFPMVLAAGRRLAGVDQSGGMLARARAKHPQVPLIQVGLQELPVRGGFDAVLCVDAMANVGPEDWPGVAANPRRAVRPCGHLFLTVELIDPEELQAVHDQAAAASLPVVPGEFHHAGEGYHSYPPAEQVRAWLRQAGLTVLDEEAADDFLHLLAG